MKCNQRKLKLSGGGVMRVRNYAWLFYSAIALLAPDNLFCAEKDADSALPSTVMQAWPNYFGRAQILKSKRDKGRCEVTGSNSQNKSFKTVFTAEGKLWSVDRISC